jgi:hypothetical protein
LWEDVLLLKKKKGGRKDQTVSAELIKDKGGTVGGEVNVITGKTLLAVQDEHQSMAMPSFISISSFRAFAPSSARQNLC